MIRTWLFALILLLTAGSASAQQEPLDADGFLRHAASFAAFEIEAGSLALRSATEPEAVEMARQSVEQQSSVMQRLRAMARERGLPMPEGMVLEHRAALEGLAPLDGEELNRRYAESHAQALQQAIELYRAAASQDDDPALKALAAEILPDLEAQATRR
jgi:putative membrane protein